MLGCGGGGSTPTTNGGNNGGGGSNGGGSPLPAGTELLYVGDNVGVIHGFAVDPNTGKPTALTPATPVTNQAAASDVALEADLGSNTLYATSNGLGGPNVVPFLIDHNTGALSASGSQTLSVAPLGLAAAVGGGSSGSGCCLYVFGNSAQLFQFTINSLNASLTQKTPSIALPCIPHGLAAAPSGSWLGVTCDGTSGGEIVGLTRDPLTGAVGTPQVVPSGGNSPQGIRVTPDGKFVIVANQGTNNVSVFSLDSTSGALTAVSGSPFASGTQPGPVAIAPPLVAGKASSAKFVFVGDTGGNTLSTYAIDSAGNLAAIGAPTPLGTDSQPSSIAVDSQGKFVFISIVPREMAGFTLDSSTGTLTPIPGSPFAVSSGGPTRGMVFIP
jgi:6-phosphogluconolactonase (cycloisomerase 2 family)